MFGPRQASFGMRKQLLDGSQTRRRDQDVRHPLRQQLRRGNAQCRTFAPPPIGCQHQGTTAMTVNHALDRLHGKVLSGGHTILEPGLMPWCSWISGDIRQPLVLFNHINSGTVL